ncbi:MAG: glycosyltransferase [Chitinivibrionales bacterium]|nr:glycosyltransferase [Chitinivibrionales bacterium]MBD3358717.1 glycosyltransferase [Chitinivibrionales bacterium]
MAKVDLHVHTKYSAHPSEWFLQRIGASESYTEPDALYESAKARGMDFVTVTDHNQIEGALYLKKKHPDDVLTGVEVTTYFPEDRCKAHVLVYGLNESQFRAIDRLRGDIFHFRDYLKKEGLAHSVAHATFSVNHKLRIEHVEKLILLFDYFEGINGQLTWHANETLVYSLCELTPDIINELRRRYEIEPFSDTPWHKGLTGGSDDHCGLFIGKTCTEAKASTPEEFLSALKAKTSFPRGACNDFQGFAFSIYKIAYDFSRGKGSGLSSNIMHIVNGILFEGQSLRFRDRFALSRLKKKWRKNGQDIRLLLADLVETFEGLKHLHPSDKLPYVYDKITVLSDELVKAFVQGIGKNLSDGDVTGFIRNISGLIPAAFLSVPFFTTLSVQHGSRDILDELTQRYLGPWPERPKKVLWFTDTLVDLNGVSETIQKLGWLSYRKGVQLIPVSCLNADENTDHLPPNVMMLDSIASYTPSFFRTFVLRIPSVLAAIRRICERNPDEILVSTPGPVGLVGVLAARLLHIPCKMIYHTDFTEYTRKIIEDEMVCRAVREYVKWFYSMADEIKVPSKGYMDILERRGYNRSRMKIFRRGIDKKAFAPQELARDHLRRRFKIPAGLNMLYAGRVSLEKNVDILEKLYKRLVERYPDLNLLVAGDGPYVDRFARNLRKYSNVHLLGRLQRAELPLLYSGSDLFVFPSTTDTFGMVVLEAQACGLPAIVTDKGGPQEIVADGETGYVVDPDDMDSWVARATTILDTAHHYPERHLEMRNNIRTHILRRYDWDDVLRDILGTGRLVVGEGKHKGPHSSRDSSTVTTS